MEEQMADRDSFDVMMDIYGEDLLAIGAEQENPVEDTAIECLFEALEYIAPRLSQEPFLAATVLIPLIREVGRIRGLAGAEETKPRQMLECGLGGFREAIEFEEKLVKIQA
jgi:hypothetical protein